ncbi:MAG: S24 family peptidase [Verrucomicrobiales bacterium]
MEKTEVDRKLALLGKDRKWLARKTGYSYDSLRNLLAPKAKPLSFAMSQKIAKAFEDYESTEESGTITCHPTPEQLAAWLAADLVEGDHFTDFAIARINKLAESINSIDDILTPSTTNEAEESNITPLKPHLDAAAGASIASEVIDWEGDNDTINVRANGLSMTPLINDGDVITMRLKKASRSPYMKKGLIYLVDYAGGYTIKRFNTRPPREDEQDADYLNDRGRVMILESINPDYPEIIVKDHLEWVAWLDPGKG